MDVTPLTAVSIFSNMSGDDLRRLAMSCTILEIGDGTTIFAQGDPADSVWALIAGDGHVRIGAIDRHSKALMVEVFRAGEIFGEVGVVDGGSRTASAVAEGKVRVIKIRGTAFLAALASSPALGDALCRMMAQRLRRTFQLFQDATFETLEVRLARQILYLAARGARKTPQGLRLPDRLRQPDLADLLGASTSRSGALRHRSGIADGARHRGAPGDYRGGSQAWSALPRLIATDTGTFGGALITVP